MRTDDVIYRIQWEDTISFEIVKWLNGILKQMIEYKSWINLLDLIEGMTTNEKSETRR